MGPGRKPRSPGFLTLRRMYLDTSDAYYFPNEPSDCLDILHKYFVKSCQHAVSEYRVRITDINLEYMRFTLQCCLRLKLALSPIILKIFCLLLK